jgi:hypothetical protein
MDKGLLLAAAMAASGLGMGWLALSMEVHWQQVRGSAPLGRNATIALRVLGASSLAASLLMCLRADHPTMAALVWVMTMTAGAGGVAFLLAWRPRLLWPLAGWRIARR